MQKRALTRNVPLKIVGSYLEKFLYFRENVSVFHESLLDFREKYLIMLCRNMPPYKKHKKHELHARMFK